MNLKKIVLVCLVAVFLLLPIASLTAAESGLPCYDMWRGCLDGGGSASYCEGVWLGCMNSHYEV